MDFYFRGVWRLDWGVGNPNTTAAIIAMLMIAVWSLAWIRRWLFPLSWILFTGLGVCLVHTFSRGGLLAASLGLLVLLVWIPRPWGRWQIAAIALALAIFAGASVRLGANTRYAQGIAEEDRSITNRFRIWKTVPRMIVDAPEGWGSGQSAWAFMQWYQDVSAKERYRNLVSSHFTYLVEVSWLYRIGYLLAWSGAFLLCWPGGRLKWLSVPLAVLTASFIAAIFTHIGETSWIWVLPASAVLAAVVGRFVTRMWPRPVLWSIPISATVLILTAIWIVGAGTTKVPIRGIQNGAIAGGSIPSTWVIGDPKVLGEQPGKTLRRLWEDTRGEAGGIGIVRSISEVPTTAKNGSQRYIVAGSLSPTDIQGLRTLVAANQPIVFLNPWFAPMELLQNGSVASDKLKLTVYVGEFSQSPFRSAWERLSGAQAVEGCGDFLPNWPLIISTVKTPSSSGTPND